MQLCFTDVGHFLRDMRHERRMNKSCPTRQDSLASAQYNGSPIYGFPFLLHFFNQSLNLILFLVCHTIHNHKELWAGGSCSGKRPEVERVCPLPLEILVDVFLKINVIEFEELLCRYIAIELVVIGTAFLYMRFKNLFGRHLDFGIQLLDEDVSI